MTEAELAAIEARAHAATPGPWVVGENDSEPAVMAGNRAVLGFPMEYSYGGDLDSFYSASGEDADLAFAAHARTDLPALVAEVRRLRGVVEAAYREGALAADPHGADDVDFARSTARAALGDG